MVTRLKIAYANVLRRFLFLRSILENYFDCAGSVLIVMFPISWAVLEVKRKGLFLEDLLVNSQLRFQCLPKITKKLANVAKVNS